MKKIIISALAAMMLALCFVFTASAAEPSFKVDISGATAVLPGDTVKYTVTVNSINVPSNSPDVYDSGLASAVIKVKYDTAFFDASTVAVTDPRITNGSWQVGSIKANGEVTLKVASDEDATTGKNPTVTANGVIKFEISLKVKSDAASGSGKEIYIAEGTEGGDANLDYVTNVTLSSLDVEIIKKLNKPTGVELTSGYQAKWSAVDNASSYEIQVYKDGSPIGKPLTANGNSYDLATYVQNNLGGSYSFTVSAKTGSSLYKDSDAASSNSVDYRGKLAKPSVELTVDKIAGTIGYKITDTNPDETVGIYIIKVYGKDGKPALDDILSEKKEGTIKGLNFGSQYSVSVIANSSSLENTETGNLSSDESNKVSKTADGIIGISVTKKPKLSYTAGESIDLSDMEIKIDFAVASDARIKRSKFSQYGITVSPKHGADVILSMSGKKITVTCGSLSASEEMVLEVKSAECSHPDTIEEHVDANCGLEGHDYLKCKLCGATVEDTVIPATGEHTFSEWEWLSKPTVSIDGVRQRTCSVCDEVEHSQVTYAEYLAMMGEGSTSPDDTVPDTSGKEETKPSGDGGKRKGSAFGGVADLGKIFLFILVAVFLVIVIFIVSAVYLESRKNRRRRSNSRTNQARNQTKNGQKKPSGNGTDSASSNRNNYIR